uniref:guanylate-binding protein 1-like n=1 Tax=Podarcis muralis TaxID=64176 RepID=UPI00109FDA41|nr:guanylate-binding protein 1-like [Podarcis muralis]
MTWEKFRLQGPTITLQSFSLASPSYVTELTKAIRAKYPSGDGQEEENFTKFGRFFPDFIWALRDFTLQLELNGCPISADKYLENALRFLQGDAEHIQKHNTARSCIHSFFPSRKCFVFDRPTTRKKLHLLEELKEEDLEEDFLVPVAHFCQHIWETSRPKMIPGDRVVTGTMLASLAKTYVNAINSGDVPCLQNAVLALSQIENSAAVHDAISCYEERMQQLLQLPTDTLEELLRAHAKCEREAIDVFIARAFGDNIKQFQEELENKLNQKKKAFCERNEKVSLDRCRDVLRFLSRDLVSEIQEGIYAVPEGYKRYLAKMNEIKEKYDAFDGKGIQADRALEEFLKSKETVAKSILHMDDALSGKEKEIEVQRAQVEATQLQQRLLEQELANLEQMMEDKKRHNEEGIQRLKEEWEEEMKKMKEEAERRKRDFRKGLLRQRFLLMAMETEVELPKSQGIKEQYLRAYAYYRSCPQWSFEDQIKRPGSQDITVLNSIWTFFLGAFCDRADHCSSARENPQQSSPVKTHPPEARPCKKKTTPKSKKRQLRDVAVVVNP